MCNLLQPWPLDSYNAQQSQSQKSHVNMTGKPTKLDHVEEFCGSLTFHFPAEEQVDITLDHHEDPVALRAIAKPVPDKSNVELPEHKG